jgi:chromosome segregation ATPase
MSRPRRRKRPISLEEASQKLRSAQDRVAELERQLEAEKAEARSWQRLVWRREQSVEATNDEIDADPLFRIRFPDHKTV